MYTASYTDIIELYDNINCERTSVKYQSFMTSVANIYERWHIINYWVRLIILGILSQYYYAPIDIGGRNFTSHKTIQHCLVQFWKRQVNCVSRRKSHSVSGVVSAHHNTFQLWPGACEMRPRRRNATPKIVPGCL